MTFEDLWEQMCSTSDLPEEARVHLPTSLSNNTKAIIENKKLSAEELTHIVLDAINQINGGSVESIDDLVMKGLEKRQV